jgi:hypothetical protein
VQQHAHEHSGQWAPIRSEVLQLRCPIEALVRWERQAECDGCRARLTTALPLFKALEREKLRAGTRERDPAEDVGVFAQAKL